ncbi:MAG: DUF2264 domain-containing protein, partial [Blautia sp.]|nr:DUF2264 domain-containing protein [Blautia sp.]
MQTDSYTLLLEDFVLERKDILSDRDYQISPCTGLTRVHWLRAGRLLLEGIFRHIASFDAPVVTIRQETAVTYPHPDAPEEILRTEKKAQIFEGLARSFLIASVIIHEDPGICIAGISLREYYKTHILRSCTEKGHAEYVGTYEEMQEITHHQDPFRPFQQTVETCALVIGLQFCREEIWQTYRQEEKDAIAAFLHSWAEANTVPQNWRLFNMLDLAFLHMEGYPIDERIMRDHAQAILAWDVGDGWYRDGHSFDYYSCWAFSFYAPLWNQWYGYEKEPYLAARFEENQNRLMQSFPAMFDEDGFTNMWGRSSIYRNAVTSAFDGNFLLHRPVMDPGFARRIASGSLLQFFERDDFLWEGIPTLGFYGQFTPLVQSYSCQESVFWMGKAFLCLHLKKDHPFWTATENNGFWEKMGEMECRETILPGPGLALTNHKANGESILRSGKVLRNKSDIHGIWGYAKLCYNTRYPWEAAPVCSGAVVENVESQQYVLQSLPVLLTASAGISGAADAKKEQGISRESMVDSGRKASDPAERAEQSENTAQSTQAVQKCNVTFWCGHREGVLYRRQFFEYDASRETHWMNAVDLADFPVPFGLIRTDRVRLIKRPVCLTLGSFGFPDNGTTITEKSHGSVRAIVLKGQDHMGRPR